MSDGNLITRSDRMLGSSRGYGIKRRLVGHGILAFDADVNAGRWTVELDLDGSPWAKIVEEDSQGKTTVSHVQFEASAFDGAPVSLPRAKGNLSIPERITFLLPREQSLPGDGEPHSLRIEVHFLNREPLEQS